MASQPRQAGQPQGSNCSYTGAPRDSLAMHGTPCTPRHLPSMVVERADGAWRCNCRRTGTEDILSSGSTLHDVVSFIAAVCVLLRCTPTFHRDQACIQRRPRRSRERPRGKSWSGPECRGPAWNKLLWLYDEQGSLLRSLCRAGLKSGLSRPASWKRCSRGSLHLGKGILDWHWSAARELHTNGRLGWDA